jgi:hypothetical protein
MAYFAGSQAHRRPNWRQAAGSEAELEAASSASLAGHRACASMPGTRSPLPPHHGQLTVLGVPPRFEMTLPLPRQAIHSRGPWDAGVRSSLSLLSLATSG